MATQLKHLNFAAAGLQYTGKFTLRSATIANRAIGAGTCTIADGAVTGGGVFLDVEVPPGATVVLDFAPDDVEGLVGVFVEVIDATMTVVLYGKGWSTG